MHTCFSLIKQRSSIKRIFLSNFNVIFSYFGSGCFLLKQCEAGMQRCKVSRWATVLEREVQSDPVWQGETGTKTQVFCSKLFQLPRQTTHKGESGWSQTENLRDKKTCLCGFTPSIHTLGWRRSGTSPRGLVTSTTGWGLSSRLYVMN